MEMEEEIKALSSEIEQSRKILTALGDEVRQHLAELGFVVDTELTVVTSLGGNLILQVRDSRVALDRSMANRIMIE